MFWGLGYVSQAVLLRCFQTVFVRLMRVFSLFVKCPMLGPISATMCVQEQHCGHKPWGCTEKQSCFAWQDVHSDKVDMLMFSTFTVFVFSLSLLTCAHTAHKVQKLMGTQLYLVQQRSTGPQYIVRKASLFITKSWSFLFGMAHTGLHRTRTLCKF